MWTRAELKSRAKSVLQTSYWYGVLAVLVLGAISIGASFLGNLIPICGSLAVSIFLTMPLSVGLYYFFMSNRKQAPKFENIFYSFNGKGYLSIVGAMAWMSLFIFLWFIIPVAGIVLIFVKGISYSMTPYILTDNPNIGYNKALKLSMAMTKGHKGKIFVLGLSFIGWGILATIPLGIGWLFLMPYIIATNSELYATLRDSAIANGICTSEDLNLNSEAKAFI